MQIKNMSVKRKYGLGLFITLIMQVLIVSALPYFLFYKIEHLNSNTKSFYLNSFHLWSYFIILWSFLLFGLFVNLINLKIKNNRHIIHAGLIIWSSIPSVVLVFPAILLFYGDEKLFKSSIININSHDLKLQRLGKLGILIFNIIGLIMIFFMFLLPYMLSFIFTFTFTFFNVTYDYPSVVTMICFFILITFNLVIISLSFYFKNEKFDLFMAIINIFTSFLPFIIGSMFAVVMFVGFRKNILLKKVKQINEIKIENMPCHD